MEIDFSWMDDVESPGSKIEKASLDPQKEKENSQWNRNRQDYDLSLWSSVDPAGSAFNLSGSTNRSQALIAADKSKKVHIDATKSKQNPPKVKTVKVGNFFTNLFFGSSVGSSNRAPPSPLSRAPRKSDIDRGSSPLTPPLSEPSTKHGSSVSPNISTPPTRKPFNAAEVALLRKFLGPSTRTALLQRPKASASSGAILQGLGIQLCQMQSGEDIDRDVCELSEIAPMSVAEKTNILFSGDVLIEVNGTFVVRWPLDKIVMILVSAGKDIVLKVTTSEALSRATSRLAGQMCEKTDAGSLSSASSCQPNDSTSDDSTSGHDAHVSDLGSSASRTAPTPGSASHRSSYCIDDSSSDSSHSDSPLLQSIQITHRQHAHQPNAVNDKDDGLYGGRFWEDAGVASTSITTTAPVLRLASGRSHASDTDGVGHLEVDASPQCGGLGIDSSNAADISGSACESLGTHPNADVTVPVFVVDNHANETGMAPVCGDAVHPVRPEAPDSDSGTVDPDESMAYADQSMEQMLSSSDGRNVDATMTDNIVAAWNACAVMQPAPAASERSGSPLLPVRSSREDTDSEMEMPDSRLIPISGGDSLDLSGIEYLSDEHEGGSWSTSDLVLSSVSEYGDGTEEVLCDTATATDAISAADDVAEDPDKPTDVLQPASTARVPEDAPADISAHPGGDASAEPCVGSTPAPTPPVVSSTPSEKTSSDGAAADKDYGFYVKLPPKKKGRAKTVSSNTSSSPDVKPTGGDLNRSPPSRQGFFSRIFTPSSSKDATARQTRDGDSGADTGVDAKALAQLPRTVNSTNSIFIDERRVARDIIKLQRTSPVRSPAPVPGCSPRHRGVGKTVSCDAASALQIGADSGASSAGGRGIRASPLRPAASDTFTPAALVMVPRDQRRAVFPRETGNELGGSGSALVPHMYHRSPSTTGKPAGLRLKDDDEAPTPARSVTDQLRRVATLGDCSKVAAVLVSVGLDKYIELFEEEEIDYETLLSLTETDLEKIGITKLGARRKILRAIRLLDPWGGSEADSDCTASEYSFRSRSVVPRTLVHQRALSGSETSLSSRATTVASERGFFGGDNSGLASPHSPAREGRLHQSPNVSPQHNYNVEKRAHQPPGADVPIHHYVSHATPDDCMSIDTNDGATDL
eukprot:m.906309 g.906309  ORF g.906309 m.906309 type:complete len:1148 (+) comp23703_c0_seq1:278-3721(+)